MPVHRLCALGHPIPEGRALCPGCGFGELPVEEYAHALSTPSAAPAREEVPRQLPVWPVPTEPGPSLQVQMPAPVATPVQVQTPVEVQAPVYVEARVQLSPDGLWSWDGVSWSPTVAHPGHHAWSNAAQPADRGTAAPHLPAPPDAIVPEPGYYDDADDDDEPHRWKLLQQLPDALTELPQRTLIALGVLVLVIVVAVGLAL